MSSEFGKLLRVSVFGQSHGKAIGVNIDGLPSGEAIDMEELNSFLDRRKPGKSRLSTMRKESDTPIFLSGLEKGVTCGSPLCAIIENSDQHSSDYSELADKPRPSHADYTAWVKWGGQAEEGPDSLTVHGVSAFTGGTVDGANDHRIVMAAAIAATRANAPVTILGAEAVNKSYPSFWDDYKRLGGVFDVL